MAVRWCSSTTALVPQFPSGIIICRRGGNDTSSKPHLSSSSPPPSSSSSSSSSSATTTTPLSVVYGITKAKARRLWWRHHLHPIPILNCTTSSTDTDLQEEPQSESLDCVGTGLDVACLVSSSDDQTQTQTQTRTETLTQQNQSSTLEEAWELAVLVSPFFFWGTAMVAMKEVLPKAGPFFVSAFRLIPAGFLLVAFAASRGRPSPKGLSAWLSIALFGLVDAACFQGFLAQGLQRTSAGLGSVIIDSQPLTVAILAALLFGESIGLVGASGLVLGVVGLLLLEVPALSLNESNFSLWGSGEWWMLLAAQSMAVGTVMVRWVSKYSDPVMATGWHMVLGGLPLLIISILNHDNAVSGNLGEFTTNDVLALLYTSIFGSAISYGVYFYNATKGSLTKLSSLTFLTPMFASIFGFLYFGETFSPLQLTGAVITVIAIYLVNYRNNVE